MLSSRGSRTVAMFFFTLAGSIATARATEAGKLVPAETEIVLTLNLRGFLNDHQNNEHVQRYLQQWRLALGGDPKLLREYYRANEIGNYEGISEQAFLDRANRIKKTCDSLGIDPLKDIDRLTLGFKKKDRRYFVALVEGRFNEAKLKTGINQVARENFGSVRHMRNGGVDLWQMPEQAPSVIVTGLNDTTIALADSMKTMDRLLALAAGNKNGGLSGPVRALLDSCKKEHAAVLITNLGETVHDAVMMLTERAGHVLGRDDPIGKLIVTQVDSWIGKYAKEFTAIAIGLSPREDDLRLQFGVQARASATVKELGVLLDRWNLWGSVLLKAIDNELTGRLADILLRQRVQAKDDTLVIQTEVPYEFIKQVVKGPWLIFISPELAGAHAATQPWQAFLGQLAARANSIPLWGLPSPAPAGALEIQEERGIAYRNGPGADPVRNRLDVYVPKNKRGFPVVVLVHGGNWFMGDNRCVGLYSSVGQFLASQGIGVVLPNYRLSPAVKHPEHVKDIARAVAWVRANIGKFGGDARQLYLMGHSAGGHLVALLATDDSYLQAEGMKATDIKGVIAVSGVYRIPPGQLEIAVGGSGSRAVRLDQVFPLRGDSESFLKFPVPGYPVKLNMFAPVFGETAKDCVAASPLTHVRRGLPPFLILSAGHDFPLLAPMADEFHAALRAEGCDSQLLRIANRNHNSLLFSAIAPEDPAARAILAFIRK